jgi:hypothetical protein
LFRLKKLPEDARFITSFSRGIHSLLMVREPVFLRQPKLAQRFITGTIRISVKIVDRYPAQLVEFSILDVPIRCVSLLDNLGPPLT